MRPVLTATDLAGVADGGELTIAAGTLITPLARDEAARRGISIVIGESPSAARPDQHPIAIGSDHGGYELKEHLKTLLSEWGYPVDDRGTDSSTAAVDYPDFAESVASAVAHGEAWRGIIIDSAGIGSSMAANKVPGARAALCYDRATARNSREHNDANVLSLGARLISPETAREIVAVWLETPFAGGRHQKRVDKITGIEQRHRKV
jgi:ribose 5-phosphate isomerase B